MGRKSKLAVFYAEDEIIKNKINKIWKEAVRWGTIK